MVAPIWFNKVTQPKKPEIRRTTMAQGDYTSKSGKIIQIDEGRIREHLGEIVRGSVQETLNALLDAEADRLLQGWSL